MKKILSNKYGTTTTTNSMYIGLHLNKHLNSRMDILWINALKNNFIKLKNDRLEFKKIKYDLHKCLKKNNRATF